MFLQRKKEKKNVNRKEKKKDDGLPERKKKDLRSFRRKGEYPTREKKMIDSASPDDIGNGEQL